MSYGWQVLLNMASASAVLALVHLWRRRKRRKAQPPRGRIAR